MTTLDYTQRPVTPSLSAPRAARPGSSPDLTFGSAPAGRATLSAITQELTGEPTTLHDRAARESTPDTDGAPAPGRETLQALEAELEHQLRPPQGDSGTQAVGERFEVFEMATFVVRGRDLGRLSSQTARRDFVEQRLKHRLPVDSMAQVDHVDVTPWTERGTVILRVWCRVAQP